MAVPLYRFSFFAFACSGCGAQPSWPIMYSYSPDSMPIIQVKLAPPKHPMPEVAAALGKLDNERALFETEKLLRVEAAYNATLEQASKDLPALVDRLMQTFVKPEAWIATREHRAEQAGELAAQRATGVRPTSFRELRSKSGGHEVSARINLLPGAKPEAEVEDEIKRDEKFRETYETQFFERAEREMDMLSFIVQNEAEVQITQHVNGFIHAQKFGASSTELLAKGGATRFLNVMQPVVSSGPALTTNVRVAASSEPFPTVASMVEDLDRKRDAAESQVRRRILELKAQLLQAENAIVKDRLGGWIEHILQTSV